MNAAEKKTENDFLEENLEALFLYIKRVRREIASLNQSADGIDKFATMAQQLDGIVEATSDASDTIMSAIEKSGEAAEKHSISLTDSDQKALIETIIKSNNAVFEACAFQDLTGQRVAKIVKSVSYVETRVNALMEVWGKRELEKVERMSDGKLTDDQKLLNGPQSKTEAISQDEIDQLFT